ncbi:MAG: type II secretion system F family protein [Frankiaceae bacterium]|nr:type II secretion system F family protein [Frankiaceae bacterium]
MLLLGLAAVFVSLLLGTMSLSVAASERQQVRRSLAAVSGGRTAPTVAPTLAQRIGDSAVLVTFARRLAPSGATAKTRRRLDFAGNPKGWDLDRVLAFKGAGLVVLGVLGLLFGGGAPAKMLLFAGAGALVGFYLPDVLLYNTGVKRQQVLQKELPDALDLLTICVEAGLGFDSALGQVTRSFKGPLAGEFFRVLQEMQIGKGRGEAFRAVVDRTDVPELRAFASAIAQADAFGIPIANVLRTQAREMRLKRQQRVEEKAQKVSVKMMVPLVLCILPAMFVVIIGPGAISIMRAFSGG